MQLVQIIYILIFITVGNKNTFEHTICLEPWLHTFYLLTVHYNKLVFTQIISLTFRYRFTKIAVDQQVRTPDGKAYDVLFIGTGMPAFSVI